MEELKSALIFEKYMVDEVIFKRNDKCNIEQKIPLQFSISKKILHNDDKLQITIVTKIFEESEKNNYPFEMLVEITGFFRTTEETNINFEPNAIAILYPYVRAIVSVYTSNANVNPLILPPINVNALFKKQNDEN